MNTPADCASHHPQRVHRVADHLQPQVGEPLRTGDRIEVRRSARQARFIHLPNYSYFAVLRQKLHWRGSTLA